MDYKKILAIHPTHDSISTLNPAIDFAKQCGAHLEVLVLTLASYPTIAVAQSKNTDWSIVYENIVEETSTRAREVKTHLAGEPLKFSVGSDCAPLGMIDTIVARSALCTDLVIFSKSNSSLESDLIKHALESALLDSGKPILVLDETQHQSLNAPEKILIAWQEVPEAAKTVQYSLPLLKAAKTVQLLIVPDNNLTSDDTDSAENITHWLACHDVTCETKTVDREGRFVSHALSDYINEHPSNLVVMGAYGHTRLRERLFAGATYVALGEIEAPLFLSH